ncbi:MAG: zf-HC2 domain-containing protein [Clostridia bacterium]|nr:zf-HC2 domain-containing protein [Clostridia bacterium]
MNPCKITEDLLPLYVEGTCNPGSREYVEEHVKACPKCQALLDSMKESVEIDIPKQDAKKSFRRLSAFLVRRRVLTITLCVLLSLAGLTVALWHPLIQPQLFHTRYFLLSDIDAQFSRLSDGSIYARFTYTGDEHTTPASGISYGRDGNYHISFQYQPFYDFILPADPGYTREAIIHTAESEYVYNHMMTHAVSFTLIGADGERLIWKEGDELPPAGEEGEALLRAKIESGYCIPVEEWRRRLESGEIEFG